MTAPRNAWYFARSGISVWAAAALGFWPAQAGVIAVTRVTSVWLAQASATIWSSRVKL